MKTEFKNLFLKKSMIIILAILITITIVSWLLMINDSGTSDVHHNFISQIQEYNNQETLQKLYDSIEAPTTGIVNNTSEYVIAFRKSVYKFSLDNELPYDSLVTFSEITKYTPFHYFSIFNIAISLFIVLASILIGSFYQTSDIMSKISKLVYTSGDKRTKIIDRKYGASLILLLIITFILDIIFSLLGLIYNDSGAKYCIVFTGSNLYALNYFQFVCLIMSSHLLMLCLTYTFVYYLSVIIKNGIVPMCIFFVGLIIYNFALKRVSHNASTVFDMILRGGFIGVLYNNEQCVTNLNMLWYYIAIIVVATIPAILSRPFIKRADYSR